MGPYAGVDNNKPHLISTPESTPTHLPWATRADFIPQPKSLDLVFVSFYLIYRSYSIPYVGVIGQLAFSPSFDEASPFLPLSKKVVSFSQSSCVSSVDPTYGMGEGGSQITGRRDSLVLFSTLNTLCACPYPSAARLR